MIIVGDIGGTKTVLALFDQANHALRYVRSATFASLEFRSLEEAVDLFLSGGSRPELTDACFGVAGPVEGGRARLVDPPWMLDEEHLAKALRANRVRLLNDLEAAALGMVFLGLDDFEVLQVENLHAIAPGTGLGEVLPNLDGRRYHDVPFEGDQRDFAPRTDDEIGLSHHMRRVVGGHVSYERTLTGAGIGNLDRCLRTEATIREPDWLTEGGDPDAAIGSRSGQPQSVVCAGAAHILCGTGCGGRQLGAQGSDHGGRDRLQWHRLQDPAGAQRSGSRGAPGSKRALLATDDEPTRPARGVDPASNTSAPRSSSCAPTSTGAQRGDGEEAPDDSREGEQPSCEISSCPTHERRHATGVPSSMTAAAMLNEQLWRLPSWLLVLLIVLFLLFFSGHGSSLWSLLTRFLERVAGR